MRSCFLSFGSYNTVFLNNFNDSEKLKIMFFAFLHINQAMTTVNLLNLYRIYINKIITFYYIIGHHGNNHSHIMYDNFARFNESMNLMELGFGTKFRRADKSVAVVTPEAVTPEAMEVDIEMALPKLTLIHPDDCRA